MEELNSAPSLTKAGPDNFRITHQKETPQPISAIESIQEKRSSTGIHEFDRVIGGGVVPGSVILIGGDPGIGKSTLLLQASDSMAEQKRVLYVTGEESIGQTKMRADRLGSISKNLFIVSETNLDSIIDCIKKVNPDFLIVDSIQVIYKDALSSSPGSVSQVRLCGQELTFLAKKSGMAIFLIGHVTKEGNIAGPRVLEHMVDTVLYFEGEKHLSLRILRAVKNRFGSTNEIGIFEMTGMGLKEVSNPSGIFIEERPKGISGFAVVPTLEGTRPLLVEIQALVSPSNFTIPKREARGIDYNRISLIAAVLERRVGLEFARFDVYVNVAGGIKIVEPAIDLGVALTIASNHRDLPLDSDCVVMGEVGLGGEIRAISQIENRLKESARLGFKRALIPKANWGHLVGGHSTHESIGKMSGVSSPLELIPVSFLKEALDVVF